MGLLGFALGGTLGGDPPVVTVAPIVPPSVGSSPIVTDVSSLPRALALDVNGDLDLSSGTCWFVSDEQSVAQGIGQALSLIMGEWFLDLGSGFDLFGKVLTAQYSLPAIETEVRRVVLAVPGVTAIVNLDLELNRAARSLSMTGQALWTADALSDAIRNPTP